MYYWQRIQDEALDAMSLGDTRCIVEASSVGEAAEKLVDESRRFPEGRILVGDIIGPCTLEDFYPRPPKRAPIMSYD